MILRLQDGGVVRSRRPGRGGSIIIADPDQKQVLNPFGEKGFQHPQKVLFIDRRNGAKIAVRFPLTPQDEAVSDGNVIVRQIPSGRLQAQEGILQKRRAGLPFPDGGAALGGGDADDGRAGLPEISVDEGGDHGAGLHAGLKDASGTVFLCAEGLFGRIQPVRIADCAKFPSGARKTGRSALRKARTYDAASGHVGLSHEKEQVRRTVRAERKRGCLCHSFLPVERVRSRS